MAISVKNIGIVVVVGIILLIVTAVSIPLILVPGSEVPFETIRWWHSCDITTRGNYVITDLESWQELWDRFAAGGYWSSDLPLPEVNFNTEMVIAAFQGERSTSGYWTNITRITFNGTSYDVYIEELHPGNCGVHFSVTEPHHIVKLPKRHQGIPQVRFIYNIINANCTDAAG